MEILHRNDYYRARVSCRSDLSIPSQVKEMLDENMRRLFKKSCFGVFFDMVDLEFHGQLYLHLVFKQDSARSGDKLIFHVNKTMTEFGPTEFSLITGLRFGSKGCIPSSSRFYKEVFRNKKKLFVIDIKKAFETETKKCTKYDPEKCFKLGLLWILYGVLLMKKCTNKRIDVKYIHLMDDLDSFNNFPWGRVAYDFLVASVRKSMGPKANERRLRRNDEDKQGHMDIFGFSYALLFWAYEVIPCVSELCATRRSGSSIPRMLKWTWEKWVSFDILSEQCFPILKCGDESGERYSVLPKMIPTTQEKKMPYYKSLLQWVKENKASSSKNHKRTREELDDDKVEAKMHTEKKKKKFSSEAENSVAGDPNYFRTKLDKLEHTMNTILSNQKFICKKMGWSFEDQQESKDGETHEKTEARHATEKSAGSYDKTKQSSEKGGECDLAERVVIGEIGVSTYQIGGNGFDEEDMKAARVIDEIFAELDALDCEEKLKESKNWAIVVHKGCHSASSNDPSMDLVAYDPLRDISDDKAITSFKTWYESSKGTNATIPVSVENIPMTDHKFFAVMWETNGWLEMKNIDALFNLLILKVKKWPKLFKQGWTTVDMFFWGRFTDLAYKDWAMAKLKKKEWDWAHYDRKVVDYVLGTLPRHGVGLSWKDAEIVYGVGNINTNHWVLYEIRFKDKEIVVYDSLAGSGQRASPKTMAAFRRMASLMPSLCNDLLGTIPHKSTKKKENKTWSVTLCPNAPQQTDGDSCGIIACKMLECLVSHISIDKIDPTKVEEYRKRYCVELFDKNSIML